MKSNNYFDIEIKSETELLPPSIFNFGELIFRPLPHRDENALIILSHDNHQFVSISLKQLRFIITHLYKKYKNIGFQKGDTVLITYLNGNNELFIALQFLALTSFGIRVLLPMFMEINELSEWLDITGCKALLISEKEITSLKHHESEMKYLCSINDIVEAKNISSYDLIEDFNLRNLLYLKPNKNDNESEQIINDTLLKTDLSTEALLITTSGSSGKSKLILYEQGAFINSCLSYQAAGLFKADKLGGRSFTPLFCHTMGIRALFNALWSGSPVCLITSDLFLENPEIAIYLLIRMKPENITGGPSVYNLILELMRYFPELKESLSSSLKTIVSSGAPSSNSTMQSFRKTFDIRMHNAFGTTETQQVLNTLILEYPCEPDIDSLGAPLPGITIGLKKYSDDENLYRLYINSPFGMKKIFNEEGKPEDECPAGFYNTGDIVSLVKSGRIVYIGRENSDFFKDGFGVKIPINSIKIYYKKLHEKVLHVEYYPINSHPGLAALIFINDNSLPPGRIIDRKIKIDFSQFIGNINNNLYGELMPFEFQHRTIKRIAIVNSIVPMTIKGNVSKNIIQLQYSGIIKQLCDPFSSDLSIKEINFNTKDLFTRHLTPYIGQMLSNLGMDYTYHRAKKDSLYTYKNGKEIEVLDFVGGFGTNLLGHNNEEIKSSIISFLQNNEPAISDQGSYQKYAGLLAEELNRIVGGKTGKEFNVILGSTGSEAVEIALHHAFFEWKTKIEELEQKQFQEFGANAGELLNKVWADNKILLSLATVHVITLKKSFHGHSSGSRALLGNNKTREYFKNIIALNSIFIDDESTNWKNELDYNIANTVVKLKIVKSADGNIIAENFNFSTIIAAIAEPILGEGGVRIANRDLLIDLSHFNFPLIMDEIQCGLGRTGSFPASAGLEADYYLFAKALGGGVEKISTVLISKSRFKEEFGEYYSSTFANGGLAAKTALKTLSIIEKDNIPLRAKEMGTILHKKLTDLKLKYPDVIEEITGCGLIQGVRFKDFSTSDDIFLRNLYKENFSGYVFASFLLRNHCIRILPTLSAPNTLRIEPSAFITEEEIDKLVNAIKDLASIISKNNMYELFRTLMDDDKFDDNKGKIPTHGWLYNKEDIPKPGAIKVAFIAHFTKPIDELRLIEKDFSKASDTGLRTFLNHIQILLQMKPMLLFSKNLYNSKVHFSFYHIPIDTAELEKLNRKGKKQKIVDKIQKTINIAAQNGAKIISLGAYTSIISNNGLSLAEPPNCKIITGNTLAAASGVRRILEQIKKDRNILGSLKLGVVGAGGNIGSVVASALIKSDIEFEKLVLFGKSRKKLNILREKVHNSETSFNNIDICTDLSMLKECNIIISACNSSDPIIFPHHLNENHPILISDLSVPPSLSLEIHKMKNINLLTFASYVRLSEDPDFIMSSETPKGTSFCCAAEAILLALEPVDLYLKGRLKETELEIITQLAEKHHFFDKMQPENSLITSIEQ